MGKKRQRATSKWDDLSWKPVEAGNAEMGNFEDCVFFSLEEVDGSAYESSTGSSVKQSSKPIAAEETKAEVEDDFSDQPDEIPEEDVEAIEEPSLMKSKKKRLSIRELRAQHQTSSTVSTEAPAPQTKQKTSAPAEQSHQPTPTQATQPKPATKPSNPPSTKAITKPQVTKASKENESSKKPWGGVDLHPEIVNALNNMNFSSPTAVQRETIPQVITFQKDLIAAAETGSGKTLAYALPVIQTLLARWSSLHESSYRPLFALVVTPTRELALQVLSHFNAVLEQLPQEHKVRAMSIVGGMAEQKQKRLLGLQPHIIVATPGRLWELIEAGEPYLDDMSRLQYLIIDEADRMAEEGAFAELTKIIAHVQKNEALAKEVWKKKKSRQHLRREKDQKEIEHMYDFKEEKIAFGDPRMRPGDYDASRVSFNGADVTLNDSELLPAEFAVEMLTPEILAQLNGMAAGPAPAPYDEDAENNDGEEEEEHEGDEQFVDFKEEVDESDGEDEDPWLHVAPSKRQTLLFSATMMVASKAPPAKQGKRNKKNQNTTQGFLKDLMRNVGLRGNPAVVDMTSHGAAATAATGETKQDESSNTTQSEGSSNSVKPGLLPPTLVLAEIICTLEEKDTFMYYILNKFSGRTLVFSNSIEGVKKITHFLTTLRLPARALHAQMQQRQRLKTMDIFRENDNAILVATDVAARGLDIPDVQHVLHYDVPRSTQIYIHRSGRTARANRSGIAISLVSPQDSKHHSQICEDLAVSSLPAFPIELAVLAPIRDRARLAVQVSKQSGASVKESKATSWLKSMAAAAEIEVDEDDLAPSTGSAAKSKQLNQARQQLNTLLQQPLLVKKRKFIDVAAELQAQRETPTRADELVTQSKKHKKH